MGIVALALAQIYIPEPDNEGFERKCTLYGINTYVKFHSGGGGKLFMFKFYQQ